jgi:hypothetical protein
MAAAMCTYSEVSAVNYIAPSDLGISVGNIEIDRSELHGDTLVEVPVYIRNNEGFVSLEVIFELDSRLRFDRKSIICDTNGIRSVNSYNCSDSGNCICASFEADDRFSEDGVIGRFRVVIPEYTEPGTYDLAVLETKGNHSIKVQTYNNRGAEFGIECFSLLQGGSITVTNVHNIQPNEQQQGQPNEQPDDAGNEPDDENNDKKISNGNDTNDKVTTAAPTTTKISASKNKTISKTTTFTRNTTVLDNLTTAGYSKVNETTGIITTSTATIIRTSGSEDDKDRYEHLLFTAMCILIMFAVTTAVIISIIKGGSSDE